MIKSASRVAFVIKLFVVALLLFSVEIENAYVDIISPWFLKLFLHCFQCAYCLYIFVYIVRPQFTKCPKCVHTHFGNTLAKSTEFKASFFFASYFVLAYYDHVLLHWKAFQRFFSLK